MPFTPNPHLRPSHPNTSNHLRNLAIRAGVPAHVVSKRLGHANVGITMSVYTHAFPSDDRDLAERVAAVMFGT
jgi:integrase